MKEEMDEFVGNIGVENVGVVLDECKPDGMVVLASVSVAAAAWSGCVACAPVGVSI